VVPSTACPKPLHSAATHELRSTLTRRQRLAGATAAPPAGAGTSRAARAARAARWVAASTLASPRSRAPVRRASRASVLLPARAARRLLRARHHVPGPPLLPCALLPSPSVERRPAPYCNACCTAAEAGKAAARRAAAAATARAASTTCGRAAAPPDGPPALLACRHPAAAPRRRPGGRKPWGQECASVLRGEGSPRLLRGTIPARKAGGQTPRRGTPAAERSALPPVKDLPQQPQPPPRLVGPECPLPRRRVAQKSQHPTRQPFACHCPQRLGGRAQLALVPRGAPPVQQRAAAGRDVAERLRRRLPAPLLLEAPQLPARLWRGRGLRGCPQRHFLPGLPACRRHFPKPARRVAPLAPHLLELRLRLPLLVLRLRQPGPRRPQLALHVLEALLRPRAAPWLALGGGALRRELLLQQLQRRGRSTVWGRLTLAAGLLLRRLQ
jgi:hypothetical protein